MLPAIDAANSPKRLAIMQPYFFPYLGYFSLIAASDQFIVFDVVQYIRHGWINRNRIIYWGDIDVEGFLILSRLRNLFENVESILMDETSLEAHIRWAVPGNGTKPVAPTNLTAEEALDKVGS